MRGNLYRNELDKACFGHNATYSDNKNLSKRTISDKILRDKGYEKAKNRNYTRALASMVYKIFIRKQDQE